LAASALNPRVPAPVQKALKSARTVVIPYREATNKFSSREMKWPKEKKKKGWKKDAGQGEEIKNKKRSEPCQGRSRRTVELCAPMVGRG
jgi:hypothetical protein